MSEDNDEVNEVDAIGCVGAGVAGIGAGGEVDCDRIGASCDLEALLNAATDVGPPGVGGRRLTLRLGDVRSVEVERGRKVTFGELELEGLDGE